MTSNNLITVPLTSESGLRMFTVWLAMLLGGLALRRLEATCIVIEFNLAEN